MVILFKHVIIIIIIIIIIIKPKSYGLCVLNLVPIL